MKKISKIIALTTALSAAASALCSCAETDTEPKISVENPEYYTRLADQDISINVYNWGEYIADGSDGINVNDEFTKLTGIKVNYSTYATNEELYAKLKGGASTYDIIIPSDYMISRMIKEDMLEKIDFENIPNFKYIKDAFKNPLYDEENSYSVPYLGGTVGIIYDKTVITDDDFDWDILWDEKYADQILMFDNPRDAFAIAEAILGYSMNTEDEAELEAAGEKLKEQKSVIQAYVMDQIFDIMGAGEAVAAPYYAGDAVTLMEDNENLGFKIPESGTNYFMDAVCIPKGSANKEAAEMYINFLCEPEVGLLNTEFVGYSTPNEKVYELLSDERKNDGFSYPSDEFITEHTTVFKNLSDEANQKMQDLWTAMKSSN